MKRYSDGKVVVELTEKAYNSIYKNKGFKEIINGIYNREELETYTFAKIKQLHNFEGLSSKMTENTREDMMRELELIYLTLKEDA